MMRISGWLYLVQQTFGACMLLAGVGRCVHVRLRFGRLLLVSLLCGVTATASAMHSTPWMRITGLIAIAAAPHAAGVRLPISMQKLLMIASLALLLWCVGLMHVLLGSMVAPPLLPIAAATAVMVAALLRRSPLPDCASIRVTCLGNTMQLTALIDSGNLLCDPLTALPVIILSRSSAIACGLDPEALPQGMRLIRARSASGTMLMPVFRPERVTLQAAGQWRAVEAVVGVAREDGCGFEALVPSSIIQPLIQGGSSCNQRSVSIPLRVKS